MDLSLIMFASGVIFGGASAILATNKNRDPLVWFAIGFVFSFIALIVIAALSPIVKSQSTTGKSSHKNKSNGFPDNPVDPERPWLG
ncbi:hypothetical protein [Rhizobium leguminosarum]